MENIKKQYYFIKQVKWENGKFEEKGFFDWSFKNKKNNQKKVKKINFK